MYIYVYTYPHMYILDPFEYIDAFIYVDAFVYVTGLAPVRSTTHCEFYTCMYMYIFKYMYMYICQDIYTRDPCVHMQHNSSWRIYIQIDVYLYIYVYTNIYIHVYILRYIHMRPLCICRPLFIHTQHNSFSLQSTPRKRTLEVTHMNSRAVKIQVLLQLPVDSPNVDDGWSLITYT